LESKPALIGQEVWVAFWSNAPPSLAFYFPKKTRADAPPVQFLQSPLDSRRQDEVLRKNSPDVNVGAGKRRDSRHLV
jgi:hypothetical protein